MIRFRQYEIKNLKRWLLIHRWTSLICTLFLLMLCLTGLPLIFGEEIDDWLSNDPPYQTLPASTPMANVDPMVRIAHQRYPNQVISFVFIDDEEPQVLIGMLPTYSSDPESIHELQFDSRTARLLKDEPPENEQKKTFTGIMLSMHADLFMDLPGELFLGLMGLLFVISIISGVILYGPFTKKLDFGTVRRDRSKRMKWLDLHNLLGIATMVWLLVVGATGVINELSTPLFGLWQQTDVKKMLDQYQGKSTPLRGELHSLQAAYDTAKKALPGTTIVTAVYPGDPFGSPYHYLLWAKGNEPLTSRMFRPVLVGCCRRCWEQVTGMEFPGRH